MPIKFFHSVIHLAKLLLMIDSLICSLMFLLFVTKLYFVISKSRGEKDILYTQCIKAIIAERRVIMKNIQIGVSSQCLEKLAE